ncbi:hypothetical protein UFOVP998_56 [uncultured Caudovirales phage]|uniref:Uncharacterized protein n=1 Tax=uncultured Caudovirales phage TaxID=2100421 RepID=A0A6J5Q1Y4_9CAUD|nr:hypothetical protein UFOVP998_56 [uncultured Caudovirales phage]CAB4198898.1 hypothetical protein UFOVP1331_3 [uncultured Caudovirales phage]CAB4212550.1 hypothetical protein UFOVP1442_10 [uncultured Caudovirales phage]CAB5228076.1 hypothetical protein UFOVP1535_41 [uncultured Caudovirales phage]
MMMQRRLCIRGERCQPLTDKGLLNCAVLHHPELTSDQIAREAKIKHARLLKYASESQPDQIPADALHRLCAFLNRWDLEDARLSRYGRRTTAIDEQATDHSALDEAVDVTACAAGILKAVRDFGQGGFDIHEQKQIEHLLIDLQREADQVLAAIRARRIHLAGGRDA